MIETVAKFIRQHGLLKPGERAGVAVSGGADSVALLRVLLELRSELGIVLVVVHFNHKIRGAESDDDERFVRELAEKIGLSFLRGEGDVPAYSREHGLGMEAAARKLRYKYFGTLFQPEEGGTLPMLDKIATAHTQNDQAETVLMRLLRGAGTRGLSGIHTSLADIDPEDTDHQLNLGAPRIIRPLLAVTRDEIIDYLRSINQPWREDSSNRLLEHTRNRVRHELIPTLEREFNPAITRVLAEHAEIAQAEEEYWNSQVEQVLPAVYATDRNVLKVDSLLKLPLAMQRRVIRTVAERNGLTLDFEHIEAARRLAHGKAGLEPRPRERQVTLPGGVADLAVRGGVPELMLRLGSLSKVAAKNYEYRLPVPGSVAVPEIGGYIHARLVTVQEEGKTPFQSYNQAQLLNPMTLSAGLTIRNWRHGDRFWPAHTKSPKKVKELLQKMAETERRSWPVVISGNEIVWMRGFPSPACFSLPANAPASTRGLLIEESETENL